MRKFAIAALGVFALLVVQTQVADAQSIGFKVGMTSSNLSVSDDADLPNNLESMTSLGGGGFVRFGMGGLSLQAELLAVTKGAKFQEAGATAELQITYIEIPVSAVFSLGNGPYVFAGGAVGFESSCKFKVELNGNEDSEDCDDDGDGRSKTDFSVLGGAGLQFRAGPGSILVEARYTLGLKNLNTSDDEGSIKNRSLGIFAGYAIPIGR